MWVCGPAVQQICTPPSPNGNWVVPAAQWTQKGFSEFRWMESSDIKAWIRGQALHLCPQQQVSTSWFNMFLQPQSSSPFLVGPFRNRLGSGWAPCWVCSYATSLHNKPGWTVWSNTFISEPAWTSSPIWAPLTRLSGHTKSARPDFATWAQWVLVSHVPVLSHQCSTLGLFLKLTPEDYSNNSLEL